jgi:hypothetical protein
MMGGARYRETLRIVRSRDQLGWNRPHFVAGEFDADQPPSEEPVPGGARKIVPSY